MGREPNGRRLTWLTRLRLGALSRLTRQKPRSSQTSSGGAVSGWPTLSESTSRLGGQAPRWDAAAAAGEPDFRGARGAPGTLWQRFQAAPRRRRVGLAAGAGGLALVALIGVVMLCSRVPLVANGTPGAGGANGQGTSTASVTASPAAPFAITFTCASGTVKRTGKVCVHTEANAVLKLTVRYCDGSYAGGRDIHGSVTADAKGDHTWQFDVHTRCAGKATATVTATVGGQTATESTTFTITR